MKHIKLTLRQQLDNINHRHLTTTGQHEQQANI